MKIGFLNLLTLVFVLAKLFGAISWPWTVVFLPTIVSLAVLVVFIIVAAVMVGSANR